jgi:hypothetical protein
MKKILRAVTPVGTFTRATATPYKFVKVWTSARFQKYATTRASVGKPGQWHKDKGYDVTWHQTREAADRAKCKWDSNAELVGVFAVAE